MREILEQLLQAVDVPNPERAQLRWEEYRAVAAAADAEAKRRADAAFAALLAWYGGSIYRHIWGFIRSDAAEDVFQEVLRKLHEKRRSERLADFHAQVLPWLRKVAIRECIDAHRRARRRRVREARAARPENGGRSDATAELQEVLSVALAQLPHEEREAVALHFFEGLDKQDAAATLGIDRDTVAARLNRALAHLQKLIPAPTGILVGGALAVPTALTARPPALSAARLGELVAAAWAKAAPSGWPLAKVAAVAAAIVLGSGLAVGGWALSLGPTPHPETSPPPAVTRQVPESFGQKHRRLAHDDVVPKLLEALRGLAYGNGEVALDTLDQYDTRLDITIVFKHRDEKRPGWVSRARFVHDLDSKRTLVWLDEDGKGRYRPVDKVKTIVLAENPITGARLTTTFPPLTRSLEILASLPADERTAAIAADFRARLRQAMTPYLGTWYYQSDPARKCTIQMLDTGPRMIDDRTFWHDGFEAYRFTSDGRIEGILFHGLRIDFNPDARRIDYGLTGEWWARDAINR